MTIPKNQTGQLGENAAVAFLSSEGYQVLERNFRNKLGEIDIIAKDKDTICFIEVKTRRTDNFGTPFESITSVKQRKIIHLALSYLKTKGRSEANVRFDVVSVVLNEEDGPKVEVIKNAFEAN